MADDKTTILDQILAAFPGDAIGLDAPLGAPPGVDDAAEAALLDLEGLLGDAAQSDYYRCSRERFRFAIRLALTHLRPGAAILDIGNAPGFLAWALHRQGFGIHGINLSDAWNSTYPTPALVREFNVRAVDIEREALPYADASFDAIMFTEVLEHIATKHPSRLLPEFRRVLKPGGRVIFSTPNVCNLSNIVALATGLNVFWKPEMFYGSMDRHNREFTPSEVRQLFRDAGFHAEEYFGINDHANWRAGAAEAMYAYLAQRPIEHPLLRNTIMGLFVVR